jgi:hypothetical protein
VLILINQINNNKFFKKKTKKKGSTLSIVEGVLSIAAMIYFFDFEFACPIDEIKRIVNFTSQPNKMPMTLKNRNFLYKKNYNYK